MLFGELDKWVPVAPQRFKGISASMNDIKITLHGAAHEKTMIYAAYVDNMQWIVFQCDFGDTGSATISFAEMSCM